MEASLAAEAETWRRKMEEKAEEVAEEVRIWAEEEKEERRRTGRAEMEEEESVEAAVLNDGGDGSERNTIDYER